MKIGLEVHVQLPTESKIFCSCPTTDASAPNTHVCPVCLGMPGSKPVLNRKVLEHGIALAKMLGCTVADTTWFSRKTYFYPDMSKGIQVTQHDCPVGRKGVYLIDGKKPVRITQIHIEEDPGKTKRVGDRSSLIDYNRSGIPLAEIVTEPDLKSPAEAREFLKQLVQDIRHTLGMPEDDERSIRCDCNISVGGERCEVKNVTGLRNVERALTFELIRQTKVQKAGGTIVRETRRFDEERGVTVSVRKKEFEADYGYIDEPDLGIFRIKELADSIAIAESPQNRIARLSRQYDVDERTAKQLVSTSMELTDLFEAAAAATDVKTAIAWVKGAVSANWKAFEDRSEEEGGPTTDGIIAIIGRFHAGGMTDSECAIELKAYMTGEDRGALRSGSSDLDAAVEAYLDENPGVVEDYRGNDKAVNKVIGAIMRTTGGAHSSADVVEAARRALGKRL